MPLILPICVVTFSLNQALLPSWLSFHLPILLSVKQALILLLSMPLAHSLVQVLITKMHSTNVSSRAMDIWAAAASGNTDIVRMHLKNGVNPNRLDMYGKSPLHWSIEKGHIEIAKVLLDNGADATLKDINGESPLSMAAMGGLKSLTELLLLRGAEMEVAAAALLGDQKFFEEYLAGEGSLYLQNARMSLLHLVASRGDYPSIIQLLINHGAEVNAQDHWNATPLTYASSFGNQEVAKSLIANGAEISAQTKDLQTPLHHAVTGGHLRVVDLLINHGADINAEGNGGTAYVERQKKATEILLSYLLSMVQISMVKRYQA